MGSDFSDDLYPGILRFENRDRVVPDSQGMGFPGDEADLGLCGKKGGRKQKEKNKRYGWVHAHGEWFTQL